MCEFQTGNGGGRQRTLQPTVKNYSRRLKKRCHADLSNKFYTVYGFLTIGVPVCVQSARKATDARPTPTLNICKTKALVGRWKINTEQFLLFVLFSQPGRDNLEIRFTTSSSTSKVVL